MYASKSAVCKWEHGLKVDSIPCFELSFENGKATLTYEMPDEVCDFTGTTVTTKLLGVPRITDLPYDNPDGSDIDFTKDYFGNTRKDVFSAGPFADMKHGKQSIIIWQQ